MRWDDDGKREYGRQIDVISTIPSNKFDNPNLNVYSKDQMDDFEVRHLQELAEQTRKYDFNEQRIVAENLDPFILYNALGAWMTSARDQLELGASIFTQQQGGNDGSI